MESLSEQTWDLVIAGTSLPQALVSLSLSRSGLKILHVDENKYYGGSDAGLSLDEAEAWAKAHQGQRAVFSHARVVRGQGADAQLKASRAYTLSLRPQIIYATSAFLPSLVTSRLHNQLEFLAVGPCWICRDGKLQKAPSTREDVFADETISRRDKMGLMKFLRHALQDTEDKEDADLESSKAPSLYEMLTTKFKISPELHLPISALTLTQRPIRDVEATAAVAGLRRHVRSMNHFGPGFAAVYPKYAGNAEIAQVACRAGAVGGAVYLLGQGVMKVQKNPDSADQITELTISDGTVVKTKYVVGSVEDLPQEYLDRHQVKSSPGVRQHNMIAIVSTSLKNLFRPIADNGPTPAVTVILVDDKDSSECPIYLQLHSEDTGECPADQCCIYASTAASSQGDAHSRHRLDSAIKQFSKSQAVANPESSMSSEEETSSFEILWSLEYITDSSSAEIASGRPMQEQSNVIVFPPRTCDIAFHDEVLDRVKTVWELVHGDELNVVEAPEFLVFAERQHDVD